MAKRKMGARKGQNRKPKTIVGANVRAIVVGKAATQRLPNGSNDRQMYKHLLLDPCNAPLIRSPYDLTAASVVGRDVQLFANTQVFGVFFFHPTFGQYSYETATDVAGNVTPFGSVPGVGRAIAGCHTVSFIAQESSRAGTLSCGVVNGSVVWRYLAAASGGGGATFKPSEAAAHIVSMERTPVDRCEINWFPGEGDSDMQPGLTTLSPTTANLLQEAFSKVNFTMVVGLSLSAGGAYQHKYVRVYEQSDPTVLATAPWTVSAASKPSYSWRDVVEDLGAKDPSWYLNTFRKIGNFISGAVSAYATMGLPGTLGYLTQGVAGMTRARQSVMSN